MVLENKETTVAYRCPECGRAVVSLVGIFSLTADMIRLKCPCGGSALELVYTRDKKVRLTVPCFLCPTPHSYLLSTQIFFDKDLFTLPCSYTGMDICFIGKKDNVDAALQKSEEELLEMLGNRDLNALNEMRNDRHELSDPQVLEIVMYVVRELAEDNKIFCSCEDHGEYEVEVFDDHLTVSCKKCGDSAVIPTNSVVAANDFLECDELRLKKQ